MAGPARYTFLPWARQGLGSGVTAADDGGTLPLRAPLDVRLGVQAEGEANRREVAVDGLRLLGPGDVTGLDPRAVVRVEPEPGTPSFLPNLTPLVEFDRPDLPWLFTPAAPDARGRLRPWLCLAAVRQQPGVAVRRGRHGALPVLEMAAVEENPDLKAGAELPDPAETWAWAHVQVAGRLGDGETLDDVWLGEPERVLSRIVSPRNLEPGARYHACLVPVFEAGRRSGLGEEVDEQAGLTPAWSAATESIRLPVYHHWEFGTGREGDFEALARLIEPRPLQPQVGTRAMDVRDAGLPPFGAGIAHLEGALRRPIPAGEPEREANPVRHARALAGLLALTDHPTAPPRVGPPLYGRHQTAVARLADAPRGWLRELNLDVRHRSAAGFGVEVVRERQEQLMASAWDQVGEVLRVNRTLRQAQLARQASGSLYRRHVVALAGSSEADVSDGFLSIAGPVRTRVALTDPSTGDRRTVASVLTGGALPGAALSSAFRRIVRTRGPALVRLLAGRRPRGDLLRRLAAGSLDPAPLRAGAPDGAVTIGFGPGEALDRPFAPQPVALVGEHVGVDVEAEPGDRESTGAFRAAAGMQLAAIRPGPARPQPAPAPLAEVRRALLDRLDPERSVARRVRARLRFPDALQWPGDGDPSLEPLLAVPEFPEPAYRALAERSQELLLPGLRHVPENTITLAQTNPAFVESVMVGLNHEMGRELLWREYPADPGGTFFRRFWDAAGSTAGSGPGPDAPDLGRIRGWDPGSGLGSHLARGGSAPLLVVVIRGELLRRFPTTAVYAVPGAWDHERRRPLRAEESGYREVFPVFRGELAPDTTFLGFAEPGEADARGSTDETEPPGWFFVLEGPPTAPRFGLDESLEFTGDAFGRSWAAIRAANPDADWLSIAWGDLVEPAPSGGEEEAANEERLSALSYAPVLGRLWHPPAGESGAAEGLEMGGVRWGENAAHMASIFLQLPVRVAIHADDMLPVEGG